MHVATQAALPSYMAPAGQLTTTAADMARFAVFLMSDGDINGRPFIEPSLMAQLGAPNGTEAARAGLAVGHGLALAGRDRHGQFGHCHPGTTIGFNAMLCVYPAQRKAFFIAINTDSETADYDRFNKLLIDALHLALAMSSAAVTKPGAPAADIAQWQGIYVPALHTMRSLAWTDIVFNFMRVSWEDGALHVAPFQSKPKTLTPTGGHLFTQSGRLDSSHVLLMGDDGRRILSDGIHSYAQVGMAIFVALWASLALGLLGLASGTLALVTALLPFALTAGLVRQWQIRRSSTEQQKQRSIADIVAMAAGLQCALVLAAWGMLPFTLWR